MSTGVIEILIDFPKLGYLLRVNICILFDQAFPFLVIYPTKRHKKDMSKYMDNFIIISKNWKQLTQATTVVWIKTLEFSFNGIYRLENQLLLPRTT